MVFLSTLSPSQMPAHELQRVVVRRRHVEHQTLQSIHFVHVVWHFCDTEREAFGITNICHGFHSVCALHEHVKSHLHVHHLIWSSSVQLLTVVWWTPKCWLLHVSKKKKKGSWIDKRTGCSCHERAHNSYAEYFFIQINMQNVLQSAILKSFIIYYCQRTRFHIPEDHAN